MQICKTETVFERTTLAFQVYALYQTDDALSYSPPHALDFFLPIADGGSKYADQVLNSKVIKPDAHWARYWARYFRDGSRDISLDQVVEKVRSTSAKKWKAISILAQELSREDNEQALQSLARLLARQWLETAPELDVPDVVATIEYCCRRPIFGMPKQVGALTVSVQAISPPEDIAELRKWVKENAAGLQMQMQLIAK